MTDYTQLIQPPEDLVDNILRQGAFAGKDRMIFSCAYVTNSTGKKEKKRLCRCTACGRQMIFTWVNNNGRKGVVIEEERFGVQKLTDGQSALCPNCGEHVRLSHISGIDPESMYNPYAIIGVFDRIGKALALAEYMVVKQFHKTGEVTYRVKKYNRYIFETDRKCIQLKGFFSYFYDRLKFLPEWHLSKRAAVKDEAVYYYNIPGRRLTDKTVMANSRLAEYMRLPGEKWPACYLRLYQRRHKLETLMQIGMGRIIADELSRRKGRYTDMLQYADWEEKSPYKIIGFDRRQTKLLVENNVNFRQIQRIKEAMGSGLKLTAENLRIMCDHSLYELAGITHRCGAETIKAIQYLKKHNETFYTLNDYWNMADRLGLDLSDNTVRYPKSLKSAHEKAVAESKFIKDEKYKKMFSDLCNALSALSREKDGLCVFIAPSENSLIQEGKLLHHCVGGYGQYHCKGECIFFIRRQAETDKPYYTLQVNIKNGQRLQLHGAYNDRYRPIPDEVYRFVDWWLTNIFQPFDINKMQFINQRTKKTA